jgi:hypothetical protein
LKHLRAETTHAESFETWLEFHRPPAEWPGLVGHLSFDEKVAETLANSVARSAPAQTSSENILVPGKFGQAMEFEGDALTHLPNVGHFNREDPFSFSVWLKPHNITARENIFSRGAGADDAASMGYEFLLIDGKPTASLIHFWPGNGIRVQALTPLAPDEWKHVVITYDGSSKAAGLKLFLDGKPLATRAVADHLTLSITDWSKIAADSDRQHIVFGQRYRDRGFLKGQLDEFYAFDRELTPVEAQQLFDGAPLSPLLAKDYQSSSLTISSRPPATRPGTCGKNCTSHAPRGIKPWTSSPRFPSCVSSPNPNPPTCSPAGPTMLTAKRPPPIRRARCLPSLPTNPATVSVSPAG